MAKAALSQNLIYQAEFSMAVTNALDDQNTFKIDLGYSIRDLFVMRIKAIEYYLARGNGVVAAFAASGDELAFGLSQDPNAAPAGGSPPLPGDLGMIDFNKLTRHDTGAAGNATLYKDPMFVKDKKMIYPDGQMCHPASLYAWFHTVNALAAGMTIDIEIFYDIQEIDQTTYQQLINTLLIDR